MQSRECLAILGKLADFKGENVMLQLRLLCLAYSISQLWPPAILCCVWCVYVKMHLYKSDENCRP